jgi:hypothetical protein
MNAKTNVFIGIAVALFVVALLLATTQDPWRTISGPNAAAITANLLAGLSSLGFAIAGGLSLIAAALASWDGTARRP